jgi:hypothetical protein
VPERLAAHISLARTQFVVLWRNTSLCCDFNTKDAQVKMVEGSVCFMWSSDEWGCALLHRMVTLGQYLAFPKICPCVSVRDSSCSPSRQKKKKKKRKG